MNEVSTIGIDSSKRFAFVSGADGAGKEVLRENATMQQMLRRMSKRPPALVGIEACRASHHLARTLSAMGHEVRLVPPQQVKKFLGRNKNDAADARAICRAVRDPDTTFVPIKSEAEQAAAMVLSQRRALSDERTRLGNRIRGLAAELGIEAPQGIAHVPKILAQVLGRRDLPDTARFVFEDLACDWEHLQPRIAAFEARLRKTARSDERCVRLQEAPGIGPVVALRAVVTTVDARRFRNGRDYAAWLGLTPRDHSTANRVRHGTITRAGDVAMRADLVSAASAVLQQIKRRGPEACGGGPLIAWAAALLEKKGFKHTAVALANRLARIVWKLLVSGERFDRDLGRGEAAARDQGRGAASARQGRCAAPSMTVK